MTSMSPSWSDWSATSTLKSDDPTSKEIRVVYFNEINRCLSWKSLKILRMHLIYFINICFFYNLWKEFKFIDSWFSHYWAIWNVKFESVLKGKSKVDYFLWCDVKHSPTYCNVNSNKNIYKAERQLLQWMATHRMYVTVIFKYCCCLLQFAKIKKYKIFFAICYLMNSKTNYINVCIFLKTVTSKELSSCLKTNNLSTLA